MAWITIGRIDQFPQGEGVPVRIGARYVVIYRVGDELFALKNLCPHEGETLHRAPPEEGAAVCKSHGWRFDLRTGECLRGQRETRVAVYPLKTEGDRVMIDLG